MTEQATVFRWLRTRLMVHGWDALRESARARLITIILCTLVIAGVVFGGALEGFLLLRKQALPGTGLILGLLFDFLFLTLGIMLIFSGGLILYGSLFASPEARFLLALPARADQVFAYKFAGAIGFSSWAFVLLGLPVLAAFGIAYSVAWPYWVSLPFFLFGFLLMPGSVGAIAALLVVNLAPRHRRQILIALAAFAVIAAGCFLWTWASSALGANVSNRDALSGLLGQLAFARDAWMPNHWLTLGLQAAARGNVPEMLFRLALVWSNGLLAYVVAAWVSHLLYRRGFNRLQTGGELRRRYGPSRLDHWLERSLTILDKPTRLLIVKDFRTFRRDPGQWLQIVIFVGLGLTYFSNSRQFYRSDLGRPFQHGVALVNLLATCMLLCAYMGRFIYPMLSLEGRKFWVLGLMPIRRRQLLIGKFGFAAVGALVIAGPLILAADLLLGVSLAATFLHGVTIVAVAIGLSGLAVGIGAILPNFRETDPSKIAVGFGGTMNLLAGLLYLLVEIALIAGPHHLHAMLTSSDAAMPTGLFILQCVGVVLGIGLATAATLIPLRVGTQALEAMEF
jgi:ABC-2 type transport system permease protein